MSELSQKKYQKILNKIRVIDRKISRVKELSEISNLNDQFQDAK